MGRGTSDGAVMMGRGASDGAEVMGRGASDGADTRSDPRDGCAGGG